MGLNKNFNGLAPITLPVLYCPPHTPEDVIPAIVSDSSHNGRVSLNTFPCMKRTGSELIHGVPHISDPVLFDEHGKPGPLAMAKGYWMFPKWYEDLVDGPAAMAPVVTPQPLNETQLPKKSNKDKGNA